MKSFLLKVWRSATQRVMSLTFVGMLVGLLVDVLIAARLGTGQSADALIIALSFPLFVDTVTRESAKSSLVPLFVERYEKLDGRAYWRFVSGMLNGAAVLGIVGMVATFAVAGWITTALGPGLEPAGQQRATLLLRLCVPMLGVAPAITLLSVVLNSQERFSVVALRNAATPLVVVVAFALSWNRPDTVLWVAGGYSVGFLLFSALLFTYSFRGGKYCPAAWPNSSELRDIWSTVRWPSLGVILRQSAGAAERAVASLVAVGGVSSYYYANRIFSAAQSLVGLSVATTHLPSMARDERNRDSKRLHQTLRRALASTLALATVGALVTMMFSESIIALIYGRAAFNTESIAITGRVLFWLGLAIPFGCTTPILTSGLYAKRGYRYVTVSMGVSATANVLLAIILAPWLGLVGIALAVGVALAIETAVLVGLLARVGLRPWQTSGQSAGSEFPNDIS